MLALLAAQAGAAPTVVTLSFPAGHLLYEDRRMALDGDVGYVLSHDSVANRDSLWSFSVPDGAWLDLDGLPLTLGIGTTPAVFGNHLLATSGFWFGASVDGIGVIDVSDPAHLGPVGIVPLPANAQPLFFQSGSLLAAANGRTGFVAGQNFLTGATSRLYSFDVLAGTILDPDGVDLPGYSDSALLAGKRWAMPDIASPGLVVVDVADPTQLAVLGDVPLPAGHSLTSSDNPVLAGDGSTVFLATLEREVFSFDLPTLALLDPDGVAFGSPGGQDDGTHLTRSGTLLAAVALNGMSILDVRDPANLRLRADGPFGVPNPLIQGSAYAGFSPSGRQAVVATIYTQPDFALDRRLFRFDTRTGERLDPPLPVCALGTAQPNHLLVTGDGTIVLLCTDSTTPALQIVYDFLPTFDDDFEDGAPGPWSAISTGP